MEIEEKSITIEPHHHVLPHQKVESSGEESAEPTNVANWRKQNLVLDIPTRKTDVPEDSVMIKITPTPKRVNFNLTPISLDKKPCESPGPSSVRGHSSLKHLLPKLSFLYRTSPDIEKTASTSDVPFPPPRQKTYISRSVSFAKIFTPRIRRTSSLLVSPNENSESALAPCGSTSGSLHFCPKEAQIHKAKVHFSRSFSAPLTKERPIRRMDSFIRVIPSPRVPRMKAGDLQIPNTSEIPNTDDAEAEGEDIPEEEAVCRICMVELCEGGETLKLECNCKGELALAHQECAVKWFSIKGNRICDVCKQEVQNLPVTLLRIQNTHAVNSAATRVQQTNINDSRHGGPWKDIPVLVIVSMLAYFCFLEQLLFAKMGTGAFSISLPLSCVLGLLSSFISSTMVSRRFIWIYALMQFALVAITAQIFYRVVHIQALLSILLATFVGHGTSMTVSSIIVEFSRWRRNTRSQDLQDSQVMAISNNQQEQNSSLSSGLGLTNRRPADAENPEMLSDA